MATSILLKFLTLKWDISRTTWRIEVGDGSFFCIFHALSFKLNFFRPEFSFEDILFAKPQTSNSTQSELSNAICMRNVLKKQQAFQHLVHWVLKRTLIQSRCCIVLSLWPVTIISMILLKSRKTGVPDHCLE